MPQFDIFTIALQGFSVLLSLIIAFRWFRLYILPSIYMFFRAKDILQKQLSMDKAVILEAIYKMAARMGSSTREIIKLTRILLEIHKGFLSKIENKQKFWLFNFLVNKEKNAVNYIELQKNIDDFFIKNQNKNFSVREMIESYRLANLKKHAILRKDYGNQRTTS